MGQIKAKVRPSKRPKKRYLLFEIKHGAGIASAFVRAELVSHFKRFFREKFFEKNIWVVGFYEGVGLGILRCGHLAVPEVKTALGSFRQLHRNAVRVRVLLASGSIKKIKMRVQKIAAAK